jgi:Zn-dependent protease
MDIAEIVIRLLVIFVAITVHEFAHAYVADLAGDPTPRMMGRVTLNPLKHLDPLGTVFIVLTVVWGFGIGWGKPVLVRTEKMRNPRWDNFGVSIAGPISNVLQAVIFAMILRTLLAAGFELQPLVRMMSVGVSVNVALAVFNMIPLGPLDGHWILGAFLPEPMRTQWYQFNRGVGSILLLGLVLFPAENGTILSALIKPIVERLVLLLLGMN